MAIFDQTFDNTFRGQVAAAAPSIAFAPDCPPTGVVLHWLTPNKLNGRGYY